MIWKKDLRPLPSNTIFMHYSWDYVRIIVSLMISVAPQVNNQITVKPSSQRTTERNSVVKQDTKIQ